MVKQKFNFNPFKILYYPLLLLLTDSTLLQNKESIITDTSILNT